MEKGKVAYKIQDTTMGAKYFIANGQGQEYICFNVEGYRKGWQAEISIGSGLN
ncbi:hypothetical protein Megpolyxen_00894 [Candidatus Megaera polyxenophila]|jgi:hypothetical protein|nr:hypothetical protein Megpolyxen_00894 [Candidatus Megaera polyxenophila]